MKSFIQISNQEISYDFLPSCYFWKELIVKDIKSFVFKEADFERGVEPL